MTKYQDLFGLEGPIDSGVTDWAEHGRVGNVSTGQPFKHTAIIDPVSGTSPTVTDGKLDVNASLSVGDITVNPPAGVVDANNSTTTPLAGDGVFTGTGTEVLNYSGITVLIDADVSGTLEVQFSPDNSDWHTGESYTIPAITAGDAKFFTPPVQAKYFRIVYTNDSVAQSRFHIHTTLKPSPVKWSSHNLNSNLRDDDDAELNVSVLKLRTAQNNYVSGSSTNGGNFKVSLEEYNGDVATGGLPVSGDVGKLSQIDLTNSDPLTVAIVDSSGDQITSFGGGTQYTEGDTDATITGTAALVEGAGDALGVLTQPLTDTQLRASDVKVTLDGETVPVTGTFWQATQPVSGTVTANAGTGNFNVNLQDGAGTDITSTAGALDVNIASGSSSGIQYTEGDTDSTITGTAVMWEGQANTLKSVSNSNPLPVDANLPPGTLDEFGHLVTGSVNNQVDIQFYRGDGSVGDLVTETNANGGTATATGGMATFSATSTANSNAKGVSTTTTKYTAGAEIYCIFTAGWTGAGAGTSYQRIGLYDANNGFFIGFEGGTFNATVRKAASDVSVAKASFSVDTLTGAAGSKFTRNGAPEAIDLTKLNVWRIRFGWVGSAPINFEVLSPDGNWVTFHRILQPNLSALPHVNSADLPVTCDVFSGNSGQALTLITNCWAAGTTQSLILMDGAITDDTYAQLTRSVITGETSAGGGGYVNVKVNPSGSLETNVSGTVAISALPNEGQQTMANSISVAVASNQSAIPVTDNSGSLTVDGTVAATQSGTWNITNVSGTVSLPTGASTSAKQDTIIGHVDGIETVLGTIDADTSTLAGAVSGTEMQVDVVSSALPTGAATSAKQDDIITAIGAIPGGGGVQYTEGDTDATITGTALMFESNTTTSGVSVVSNSAPLPISDAGGVLTVDGTVAVTQSGTWDEVGINDSGNSITVDNPQLSVVGGGTEATAMRVTIANDSTGVVSVDDNGGALTVDGTVAATQSGAWNITDISGTVSLPTGASTAAKQPALGIAGTASSDVITVQGIASMTPLTVDGSGVTQPVSGTVTANLSATDNAVLDSIDAAVNGTLTVDLGLNNDVTLATLPDTVGGDLAAINASTDGIETLLGTIDADTSALAGAVAGTEVQVDVLTSALPTGASTAANQATIIGHVDGIETVLGTIDADTSALAGAVSGTEVQVDVVASLPAGTNAIGKLAANSGVDIGDVDVTSQPARAATTDTITAKIATDAIMNGTTALTPKFAVIDAATSGDNTIVAAVNPKKIRVLSVFLVASAAMTVRFESGASGTALTGQMNLAANGGFVLPFNPSGWFETASNTLLNLELSSANSVDGSLVYVEV